MYPRPLSVDSMDPNPSWTPLHRLNRVDCRDLTCRRCRFLGSCPRYSNRMSVSTLFWSLRMLSIALHIVGCDCTTSDRKPLFQDSKMLLLLECSGVIRGHLRTSMSNHRWNYFHLVSDQPTPLRWKLANIDNGINIWNTATRKSINTDSRSIIFLYSLNLNNNKIINYYLVSLWIKESLLE